MSIDIALPDVGVDGEVEIIEICVSEGDSLQPDDSMVVVESDKATVEVPCPRGGKVTGISVKQGDKVKEGDVLLQLEPESEEPAHEQADEEKAPSTESSAKSAEDEARDSNVASSESAAPEKTEDTVGQFKDQDILVPDLGGSDQVDVIEVPVKSGDQLDKDDTLLVLESDKATFEMPAPVGGELLSLSIKEGDKVSEGDVVAKMRVVDGASADKKNAQAVAEETGETDQTEPASDDSNSPVSSSPVATENPEPATRAGAAVHAGPAVRKLARELGADLLQISPSGPKGRVLKDDLYAYIKSRVTQAQDGQITSGSAIAEDPLPDFSAYGDIERRKMEKLHRLTAVNMQKSWASIPHVTQFEEADITDMEAFRKQLKQEGEVRGIKLTPLAFLLKACAYALEALPQFNVSLDMASAEIVQKKYIHIGIAVDTPKGLVVPVIRDVDQKSLWRLADECQTLAQKAQDRKLSPSEMQGGCFTISSLGGIGGTAFTPIVNPPEVAILGVSRASQKPVYDGAEFTPRLMLPLSLSYDHRAVNGADAARFTSLLSRILGDLRYMLL